MTSADRARAPAIPKTAASLWLELEPRCNLRCQFCYNYWKDGRHAVPRRLSPAELIGCLDALLNGVSCDKAALSGGEPLLYPGLDQVLAYLTGRGIPTVLTTNGLLLTEERLRHLVGLGLHGVQVPLHAATPEPHDELTGGKSWEASIRAILLARRLAVPVTPVFVATRRNVTELSRVVQLIWLLGVHRIIFNRFVPGGLGLLYEESLSIQDAELVAELVAADPVAVRLGCVIELGVPIAREAWGDRALRHVVGASCPIGARETQLTVDSEGNLKECSQSPAFLGSLVRDSVADMLSRRGPRTHGDGEVKPCQFCPSGDSAGSSEQQVVLSRRSRAAAG